MAADSSSCFQQCQPRVVATISRVEGWKMAAKLASADVDSPDFLEVRADLLLEDAAELPGPLGELPLPVILTVRSPLEGGKGAENAAVRAQIYQRYLREAAAIDLELAAAPEFSELILEARARGVACILSSHHFSDTPAAAELSSLARRAADLGADLFKVATFTDSLAQLSTLLGWMEEEKKLPMAAMGMGRLGKISRPFLAQLGSRLNYGYLDAPLVPGQWPAQELQRLIRSLP